MDDQRTGTQPQAAAADTLRMTTASSTVHHAPVIWSPWRRVAFRFGFVLGVLYIFPLPLGLIPYTERIADVLGKPMEWLSMWFAETAFGVTTPPTQFNGSGDKLIDWVSFLVTLLVTVIATLVWSVVDRKHKAYPRLATGMWIALRYLLAYTLLTYGMIKIVTSQFPPPTPTRLDQRLGEISPMRLLWMFQGYSQTYTMFGGLAEATAGFLLFWRRTTTLGAVLAMAVMTNVVMLNLSYDVCVKLYSMQLLVIATVIAMPQLRRAVRAILGYAVAEVPPRVRSSRRRERVRLVAKIAALALIAHPLVKRTIKTIDNVPARHELYGIWKVERWSVDGQDTPASWRKLIFNVSSGQIVTDSEQRVWLTASVLPAAQVIAVKPMDEPDPKIDAKAPVRHELWRFSHPVHEQLVVDRVVEGKHLRITLAREPEGLLMTRGFHWINESPFNR